MYKLYTGINLIEIPTDCSIQVYFTSKILPGSVESVQEFTSVSWKFWYTDTDVQ